MSHQLSFSTDPKPHFIITLSQDHFVSVFGFFDNAVDELLKEFSERYFGKLIKFRLDQNNKFGFGRCGTVELLGEQIILRIWLRGSSYDERVAATLQFLLAELNGYDLVYKPELIVPIQISMGCDRRPKGYGVHGELTSSITEWLVDYTRNLDGNASTIPEVNDAMQRAHQAIVPKEIKRYAYECGVRLHSDGRPALTVFGFGVISCVIPHDVCGDEWRISSDNVDAAYQGLILLAGWVKLAEIARRQCKT